MNQNIEKINEHTWAVNFAHLVAGHIKELEISNIEGVPTISDVFVLGVGIILINNQNGFYYLGKSLLPIIQLDNDFNLERKIKHMEQKTKADSATDFDVVYSQCLHWEKHRRECFKRNKRKAGHNGNKNKR